RGLLRGQIGEVLVGLGGLLHRRELRELGDHVRAVGRVERILVLELRHEQPEELVLVALERSGGRRGGGRGGRGRGGDRAGHGFSSRENRSASRGRRSRGSASWDGRRSRGSRSRGSRSAVRSFSWRPRLRIA